MPSQVGSAPVVSLAEFEEAARHVSRHAYHTPLLTSRLLSERTGFDIRLKAEMFQKGGSYKVRGPLNKFRHLTAEQRRRGVICSSAGNHAQGVARGNREPADRRHNSVFGDRGLQSIGRHAGFAGRHDADRLGPSRGTRSDERHLDLPRGIPISG